MKRLPKSFSHFHQTFRFVYSSRRIERFNNVHKYCVNIISFEGHVFHLRIIYSTRCLVHENCALRGVPQPSLHLLAVQGSFGGCPTDVLSWQSDILSNATEAGEAPPTAAMLASREPGFWLSSAPPPMLRG